MLRRITNRLLTVLIACVWLLSGLCAKVLHLVPRHEQIVARVLGPHHASVISILIGIAEIGLGVWILSGIRSRLCAVLQMATVASMNIIELITAPDLLLFGRWNALPALLFITFVYYNEFILRRVASTDSRQWAHS